MSHCNIFHMSGGNAWNIVQDWRSRPDCLQVLEENAQRGEVLYAASSGMLFSAGLDMKCCEAAMQIAREGRVNEDQALNPDPVLQASEHAKDSAWIRIRVSGQVCTTEPIRPAQASRGNPWNRACTEVCTSEVIGPAPTPKRKSLYLGLH